MELDPYPVLSELELLIYNSFNVKDSLKQWKILYVISKSVFLNILIAMAKFFFKVERWYKFVKQTLWNSGSNERPAWSADGSVIPVL